MSDQRPARKITCEDMEMEEELKTIHDELLCLSIALGAYTEARRTSDLDRIALAAGDISLAALRVKTLAEEQKRP